MKKFIFLLFIFSISTLLAQSGIQWQKCLGGSDGEEIYSIQPTSDGGYILAGYTRSNNGDVSGHHGNSDFWVVKLNGSGAKEWQKTLGGSGSDIAESVKQSADGGYIVVGTTNSNDGDVSGNHGSYDGWVVKLSDMGAVLWKKTLGGTDWDKLLDVVSTDDGGYVMTGLAGSNEGDIVGNFNNFDDCWVIKLNNAGDIEWQNALGGSLWEYGASIAKTSDGGYVVAGASTSSDGDLTENNRGEEDYWIIKLSSNGSLQWQKSFGGSKEDKVTSVKQTTDGGYIVAGYTESTNGDVTGNHGYHDFWVLKLNSTGTLVWQQALGGSDFERDPHIIQTSNGDFLLTGLTASDDGQVEGSHGGWEAWVVKLSGTGSFKWSRTYGGSNCDDSYAIAPANDGYVLAGGTCSYDGDVSGNHGGGDAWVVKLSAAFVGTEEASSVSEHLELYPNPASSKLFLSLPTLDVEPVTVIISDLCGQAIYTATISNGGSIEVSAFQAGFYVATCITQSGKRISTKFAVQASETR